MIGKNIALWRKVRELNQDTVAEFCGVNRATISKWESGEFAPQADKLPLLAKVLGCTIDDLFKED